MTHIDYGSDLPKHFVRKFGWLPACQQHLEDIRKSRRRLSKVPLRYFTFCAADAIDVFLLERARILNRNEKTSRLEGVYYCERDETAFGQIANLIGSPEQGFNGDFDKIVLFEDDEQTIGKSFIDENEYDSDLRRKLRVKDAHERMRNAFPFDIINLDVYGAMFPHNKGIITPLLKSLLKILEWQNSEKLPDEKLCNKFTLFLTSHLDHDITDKRAISALNSRLSANISGTAGFENAFRNKYAHINSNRLARENFAEFFCLAFPKFILEHALLNLGWVVSHKHIYLYNRSDVYKPGKDYQMMHSVAVCERLASNAVSVGHSPTGLYVEKALELIQKDVSWVDVTSSVLEQELSQDLAEIINFRDTRL